jgi:rod shape-determining protein MreC
LPRPRFILFFVLFIVPIIFLSLNEPTKFHLSTQLTSVLLFPIKTITVFIEFLTVSNARITELETVVNKLQLENTELKKKILSDTIEYKTTEYILLKAQIIGRDPTNINGYLYIDMGKRENLYENQPVISISALVGKIKFVGTDYSIVETVENQGFALSALDVNTCVHGIVKKKDNLIFDFIRVNDEINVGDSIFTSGMSDIFPEGILIGKVEKIGEEENLFFKPVYITPSVQINRLTYVYIVSGMKSKIPAGIKKPHTGDYRVNRR